MKTSNPKLTKNFSYVVQNLHKQINSVDVKRYIGYVQGIAKAKEYGHGAIWFYVPFYHNITSVKKLAKPLDGRAFMMPVPGMAV